MTGIVLYRECEAEMNQPPTKEPPMSRFTDISDLTAAIPVEIIDITDCDDGLDGYIQGKCADASPVVEWLSENGVEVTNEPIECDDGTFKFYVKF
jgi:hypothetical protein